MRRAAILGCDVINCGWAARFLLNGWDVAAFDPDPSAPDRLAGVLANARRTLPALYDRPLPPEGRLSFAASPAAAAAGANWVQIGDIPGDALGYDALADLDRFSESGAIVAGTGPQGGEPDASAPIIARAHDPVYLLPLVELAGDTEACRRAATMLGDLGMWPVVGGGEIASSDRILAAITREASLLVANGVPEQHVDDALRMRFGLLMVGGGLRKVESHTGSDEGRPEALAATRRARDDTIVDLLRALRRTRQGAGAVITAHEAALALPQPDGLPVTLCRQVPETWTDYNGHMSSHHYLETGSLAGDRFMELIGVDAAYIAAGRSYFSVEDHIRYRAEIRAGDRITVTTQVLGGDGKRVHLFHFIHRGDGTLAATMETLLIHTDLTLRRACPPDPAVETSFAKWVKAHAALDRPKDAGRAISRQIG
jgi:carnitine 3-dehydrogenase